MYSSLDARPEPSQATKINLFARITNVFKLRLLFLSKVPSWMLALITPLTCSNAVI